MVALGVASATGAPAAAQTSTPAKPTTTKDATKTAAETEPTEIEADSMEFDQKSGKALLNGNVHVTNGQMEVWADRMDVKMDAKDDLETLLAIGNVVIKQGDDVAICGRAEYNATESKLILTDSPVVRRGKSMRLTAPIFTYDQEQEKFVAKGGRAKLNIVPEGGEDKVLDKYRKKKGGTGKP